MAELNILESQELFLESFKYLSNIDLSASDVPNIQYSAVAINVEIATDSNAIDGHKGYFTTFDQEMELIAKIENCFQSGQEYIHTLYTYRSVSQAVPEIAIEVHENATPEEEADIVKRKSEITRKILDILRPEIAKLKGLMSYVLNAVTLYHESVNYIIQKEQQKELIPEGIYFSLIKLMDTLLILDSIKDIKTCLQKDFSRYKRVLGSHPSIEVIEELNQLQLFLSNPDPRKAKNYIFLSLRDELKRINNHENVLFEILELANDALDNIMYMTPNEKFRFIRVQPYLMLIIDGDAEDKQSMNIFKTSKIKLNKLQKLFRANPVIPLYGDMTITLEYILQRSGHYEKSSLSQYWGCDMTDTKMIASYQLPTHWDAIRGSYTMFMVRIQIAITRCEKYPFKKVIDDVMVETSHDIFNLVSEGFQKLAKWTMLIQSMMSWKYTHPVAVEVLADLRVALDGDGVEYARVLKHNFSKEELSVLVDVISCIKSMSSILAKAEAVFAPYIRLHIHHTIQQLIQGDLVPLLHRVDKRNKPILPTLLKIRALAADWLGGVENRNDYKDYSRKSGHLAVQHPARVTSTASSQLYILRIQVSNLCNRGSEVRSKTSVFSKADLEKSDIEIFTNFYEESLYFSYLLNYSGTLRSVSDLSELWYREFFLEMTKCIQFPIEMSMPWILTEHLVSNHVSLNSSMVNDIFYVIDIYNDAAHSALYTLNTQYIYDEIEAETNLVIDQLYFLLSDVIYNHFKNVSASSLLEKSYKTKLEEMRHASQLAAKGDDKHSNGHHLTVITQRLETILLQKHIQLLGRSINFNFILGQNINNKIYRDVDFAIKRFESGDARGVVDLKQFMDIITLTHSQLSKYLQLDDFPLMVNEINESLNPCSFRGRISIHMLTSLIKDLFPNFSYNHYTERFIPSPVAIRPIVYAKPPKTSTISAAYGYVCSKSYEMQSKLTRGFFGHFHLETYLSLGMNLTDLTMIIDQVVKNILDKIKDIAEYLDALKDSIPPCKPLPYSYHCVGSYGYYEGKLKTLLSYDDLKPEVFQNFREVGNSIAFLKDLSNILEIQRQFDCNFMSPLHGVVANSPNAIAQSGFVSPADTVIAQLHKEVSKNEILLNSAVKSIDVFNKLPSMMHRQIENITSLHGGAGGKGEVGQHKTLFKYVLQRLEDFMYQENLYTEWAVQCSSTVPVEVNDAKGFHRLFSALSFLFSVSSSDPSAAVSDKGSVSGDHHDDAAADDNQISNMAEFGHGFTMAGCLLLHLLGQRAPFELMDFSTYILKINSYDTKTEAAIPATVNASLLKDTQNFISTAAKQQKLQTEILALFEAKYQVREAYKKLGLNKAVFHPPTEEE